MKLLSLIAFIVSILALFVGNIEAKGAKGGGGGGHSHGGSVTQSLRHDVVSIRYISQIFLI